MYALLKADLFNLLCIPPHAPDGQIEPGLVADAAAFCQSRRAIFLVDPPTGWPDTATARGNVEAIRTAIGGPRRNAALYFPALRQVDPLRDNQVGTFAPCGAVAGVIARTDATRGVWKAPAGLEASIAGLSGLATSLTDAENGQLNPLGVNCLRLMPGGGNVVWGARTLDGADMLASEWKYLPVRRLALFVEESLYRGTHWVVFEPNDEPLWAQIRLNVGAFMQDLFRQGAFAGTTARQAYSVLCDRTTTTPLDQERGIVNILVGFAPLRPAEFVVVRIQQLAAQAQA
jgi:phage tail sheath protein FI